MRTSEAEARSHRSRCPSGGGHWVVVETERRTSPADVGTEVRRSSHGRSEFRIPAERPSIRPWCRSRHRSQEPPEGTPASRAGNARSYRQSPIGRAHPSRGRIGYGNAVWPKRDLKLRPPNGSTRTYTTRRRSEMARNRDDPKRQHIVANVFRLLNPDHASL